MGGRELRDSFEAPEGDVLCAPDGDAKGKGLHSLVREILLLYFSESMSMSMKILSSYEHCRRARCEHAQPCRDIATCLFISVKCFRRHTYLLMFEPHGSLAPSPYVWLTA